MSIPLKGSLIEGLYVNRLDISHDNRGSLAELYRSDWWELDNMKPIMGYPMMAYMSITHPGILRGPHEHQYQTDYFCFTGFGEFSLYLCDNRKKSTSYLQKVVAIIDSPTSVIIPPGVVHAYKCLGPGDGLVLNFPDKLYKGTAKLMEVDEIRHENNPKSEFYDLVRKMEKHMGLDRFKGV